MKTYRTILLAAVVALLPMLAHAQTDTLAVRDLKVEVDMAFPQAGRSVNLSSGYSLELRDGKASAYLPFYGRAYNLPYGEGGGYDFDEIEVTDYGEKEVTKHKTIYTEISFQVPDRGDVVIFHLTLFPGGHVSLAVNSNNRAPISYTGDLVDPEKEK